MSRPELFRVLLSKPVFSHCCCFPIIGGTFPTPVYCHVSAFVDFLIISVWHICFEKEINKWVIHTEKG